jgi:hypothetical protein
LAGTSSGAKKATSAADQYGITLRLEQPKFRSEGCGGLWHICHNQTFVDQVWIYVEVTQLSRFVCRGGTAHLHTAVWEIKNEFELKSCDMLHQKKSVAVNAGILEITLRL